MLIFLGFEAQMCLSDACLSNAHVYYNIFILTLIHNAQMDDRSHYFFNLESNYICCVNFLRVISTLTTEILLLSHIPYF